MASIYIFRKRYILIFCVAFILLVTYLNYIIKPIPITRVKIDKSVMTYLMNFATPIEIGSFAWAVEGGGVRILVDTGCLAEMQTASGFPAEQVYSIEEGLKRIGWTPRDVDFVILTHLHLDHFAYAGKFRNATIILQRREYEAAVNPHPAYRHFYNTELIKKTLDGLRVEFVDGEKEIVDGVSVILTPGHTPGGQTVLVKTEKGVAAIVGFCCIRENFEPPGNLRKFFEFIVPGIHIDTVSLYDSMVRVRDAADIIIPIHDPEYFEVKSIP